MLQLNTLYNLHSQHIEILPPTSPQRKILHTSADLREKVCTLENTDLTIAHLATALPAQISRLAEIIRSDVVRDDQATTAVIVPHFGNAGENDPLGYIQHFHCNQNNWYYQLVQAQTTEVPSKLLTEQSLEWQGGTQNMLKTRGIEFVAMNMSAWGNNFNPANGNFIPMESEIASRMLAQAIAYSVEYLGHKCVMLPVLKSTPGFQHQELELITTAMDMVTSIDIPRTSLLTLAGDSADEYDQMLLGK